MNCQSRRLSTSNSGDKREATPISSSAQALKRSAYAVGPDAGAALVRRLVERVEEDALDRPEQVRRGEDDAERGERRQPGRGLEGAERLSPALCHLETIMSSFPRGILDRSGGAVAPQRAQATTVPSGFRQSIPDLGVHDTNIMAGAHR